VKPGSESASPKQGGAPATKEANGGKDDDEKLEGGGPCGLPKKCSIL
jgi:hypothetical protein